jgi:hypothetical protein
MGRALELLYHEHVLLSDKQTVQAPRRVYAMSNLSRVVWSEEMYLGPHHFQAQNRYFDGSIQFTTNQVWFQPSGLLGCEFDAEALMSGMQWVSDLAK